MRGRLLLIAGLGTGFVLGSRAGRRAYEQLRSRVQDVSRSPAVQTTVDKARELAAERAPKLAGAVSGLRRTTANVTESVHQAGEQSVLPVTESSTTVQPVGAEETGTDAAGGNEIGEGSPGIGPVGSEATATQGDDVER